MDDGVAMCDMAGDTGHVDTPTLDAIRGWPATISVREAADALGYSHSWAYQLVAQDEFPCKVIKVNQRARVVTSSLVALLEP